ncbi:zinc-binding metallopeptidase family protein [Halioxenophilus aromaticivorans]|uniref:Zinc-binding peptidase n=1 Tax=Halioxenophilus aromaticivorans TaxID=1306992 RepID=A0AAV3U4S1_9ALTE
MKLFSCPQCQQPLYFENNQCLQCKQAVGFNPASLNMEPVISDAAQSQSATVRCTNHSRNGCNWLIPADHAGGLCQACELNRYIPNLKTEESQNQWQEFEQAKRRLVYSLVRLGLPVSSKRSNEDDGISVDFIDPDAPLPKDAVNTTGHADGQITVVTNEADPVQREQNRIDLEEQYRTLLGHLRHEIGHYYWDVLVKDNASLLADYRAVFGDESQDYGVALEHHYANGAPEDWPQHFVSAYASSHPWEDWAESWAHYMHLVDLAETAAAFGFSIQPTVANDDQQLTVTQVCDPFSGIDFATLAQQAIAVSITVNSFNRSLGQDDAYPFVLTETIHNKLNFIHTAISQQV